MKRSNERGLAWPVLLCVAAAVLAGFGGAGCLGSHDDDDDDDVVAMDTSATDTSTPDTTSDTTTAADTSTAQDTSSSSGIVDNSGLPSAPIAWSASSDMIVSLCGELANGTVQLTAVAGQDCGGELEPMLRVENTHPSVRITARKSPTVVLEGTSTGTLVSVEEIDGAVPLDGDQASTFGVITFLMNATDGTTSVRLELPITNHDRQGLDNELPPAFEFHHAYEPSAN